jgi:hypothetical protein
MTDTVRLRRLPERTERRPTLAELRRMPGVVEVRRMAGGIAVRYSQTATHPQMIRVGRLACRVRR